MRHIVKSAPPSEIVAYRNDRETSFDDFPHKATVRDALTTEQGYLCCYCLRRIEPDDKSMKIEHREAQSRAPDRRYDWSNLLGACLGGEGLDRRYQTCDTRKSAEALTLNPTAESHMKRIRFRGDGTVFSEDAGFQRELDEVLNLNQTTLVAARKQRIATANAELIKRRPRGTWTSNFLEQELQRWTQPQRDGHLFEFCAAVAQEISRRLARA